MQRRRPANLEQLVESLWTPNFKALSVQLDEFLLLVAITLDATQDLVLQGLTRDVQ